MRPQEHPHYLICPHCADQIITGKDLFPFPSLRAKILQCPGCGQEVLCERTAPQGYAASQELPVLNAVDAGLQQKAEEFRASGGELYVPDPAGAK